MARKGNQAFLNLFWKMQRGPSTEVNIQDASKRRQQADLHNQKGSAVRLLWAVSKPLSKAMGQELLRQLQQHCVVWPFALTAGSVLLKTPFCSSPSWGRCSCVACALLQEAVVRITCSNSVTQHNISHFERARMHFSHANHPTWPLERQLVTEAL